MEARWTMHNITLIFTDGLVIYMALTKLSTSEFCVQYGDYHHLLHDVWPNEANFGIQYYPLIQIYLKETMLSSTDAECTNVFKFIED